MKLLKYVGDLEKNEVMFYFNELNDDESHYTSSDDICTSMECVDLMIQYIPEELWNRDDIRVLDPCAGNGNFGALLRFKTDAKNIYYNELNFERYNNCKSLLMPSHISNNDFFKLDGDFSGNWDLIIANPPYSGGGNKNRSLSNLFIERSIDLLNDTGYLCFVAPNNWMTYNNNNSTLRKLLTEGSFLVIDNDVKKFFPGVGSSFTVFVWQKGVFTNTTMVKNNFLVNDVQQGITFSQSLPFIPLYVSQPILDMVGKVIGSERNRFNYRCDLHNFTRKDCLDDTQGEIFKYRTIHTVRKTRYATFKQDIYDKWIIVIPLSTYYLPFIDHNTNTTQSVGYIPFDSEEEAQKYIKIIKEDIFRVFIHLTRYGNFNNIKVLKHLKFGENINLTKEEESEIKRLVKYIKY